MSAEPSLSQVISDADQTSKASPSGPPATITKIVEAPSGDAHKGVCSWQHVLLMASTVA
jgi:hypothetical protein